MISLYSLYYKYYIYIYTKKMKAFHYKFYNIWNLWIHPNNLNDWNISSYILYYKIHNFIDFWKIYNNFPKISHYTFFLMKSYIKPLYEDIHNINGGFFSLKINYNNAFSVWKHLSIDLLTLNLEKKNNIINGLSIIKKQNFFIIKIWINNIKYNNIKFINFNNNIYNKYTKYIKFTSFYK